MVQAGHLPRGDALQGRQVRPLRDALHGGADEVRVQGILSDVPARGGRLSDLVRPQPVRQDEALQQGQVQGQAADDKRDNEATTPAETSTRQKVSRCKIISIYKYRGRMTLHLECGEFAKNIRPGMIGSVLNGNTGGKLPGGEIKVTKVSGHYAIATTTLEKLGKNRWVKIRTK